LVLGVLFINESSGIAMITKSPINTPTQQAELLPVEDAKAIRIVEWLLPLEELDAVSSKFFARSIRSSIQHIKESRRPLGLKLRNKLSAVIIDNESYEELLSLKAIYTELVEEVKQSEAAVPPDTDNH
jgi:PHD/YefM family antitoxin component YafN of YafNO toxin-antitoxin module